MPDMMTLVSLLVAVTLHVWVGVTLGRVFRTLGGAPWKAWLPLVGQLEMLRLAARPGWHIVLLAVPVYGLVVYYQVLRELTGLLRRPARLALIGVVLLPVWAGAVTGGAKNPATSDETAAGPLGVESIFGLAARPGAAGLGAVHPEAPVWSTAPTAPAVVAAEPAQRERQVLRHGDDDRVPSWSGGQDGGGVVGFGAEGRDRLDVVPLAAQPVPPAAGGSPVDASAVLAARQAPTLEIPQIAQDPWSAPAAPAVPAAPAAPSVAPVQDQAVVPRPEPVAQPVVLPPAEPVDVPRPAAQPVVGLSVVTAPPGTGRSVPGPVPSALEASGQAEVPDHTVVINRASSRPWSLVLEDGRSFDMWAASVVVGRELTAAHDGVQMLAIPDSTSTISKTHARFDLVDGVWQVTDLGSTNGIVVTGTDGQTFSVRSGTTSVVGTRLVLGSVAMRLAPRQSLAHSA